MNMPDLLQLGAIAVIFIFAIREFFAYLQNKKTSEDNKAYQGNGIWKSDIARIDNKLDNHICGISKKIANIETDIKLVQCDIRDILIKLSDRGY